MRRRLSLPVIALFATLACPAVASPLHDAASAGELSRVRTLLDQGGDINQPDPQGFTALDLARENKHGQTASLLRERGGRSGIDNDFVRRLQQQLAFLGYEVGVPDGILGGQTWVAAEAFQRNAGLKGGRGVTRDWVTALEETTIRTAQERLNAIGFDAGTPDGQTGAKTREAIRRFRADRGLSEGATLDGETLSALTTPARATAPVRPAEDVDQTAGAPFSIVENRRRDGKVDLIQARLAYMGYGIDEVDGQMGPATRAAIERYQKEHGFRANGALAPDWEDHLRNATHRAIQRRLSTLGYDAGAADGLLGRQSRDAIQAFRRDRGLTDNERADASFLAALAAAAPAPALAAAAPDTTPATENPPTTTIAPTLVKTVAEVPAPTQAAPAAPAPTMTLADIQTRLNALGFDAGPADGEMGSRTREAIRAFQSDRGLAVSGEPDDALRRALATPAPAAAEPVPDMSLAQIQARLNELGFDAGPADGEMGSRTRKAIRVFQDAVKLPVTGEADKALMAALTNPPGPAAQAASPPVAAPPSPAAQEVALPSDPLARRIWIVQRQLGFLGFPAGTPDGQMGSATRSAIQQFERSQGRRATGQLSNALFDRLQRAVIRSVQARLASTKHDPGPADGVMGDQTRTALLAYRRENGLAETTEIDMALLGALEGVKPDTTEAPATAVPSADLAAITRSASSPTAPLGTSDTVTGTLQFSGDEWCEIGSIKLSQDWCTTFRDAQAGDQCNVTLRNGRVIAVRCG